MRRSSQQTTCASACRHTISSPPGAPQPLHPTDTSGAFRNANTVSQGSFSLHFDDETIECARTIRMFLDLIVNLKLEPGRTDRVLAPADSTSFSTPKADTLTLRMADDLTALLRFLDKYDCPVVRDTAALVLDKHLPDRIHPAAALLAGCEVDEPDLVIAALRFADRGKSDGHYESHEVGAELHARKEDKDTLDPARMPFEFTQRIPQEYMWALGRAWGGRPYPVQERFVEYIKVVKSESAGA